MSAYIIPGLNPIKAIIPTSLKSRPRDYKSIPGIREREICGAYNHKHSGSYAAELMRCSNASFYRPLEYTPIYCREHRRIELVPSENYRDFSFWYSVGLHPRFSIRKTLLGAKQLLREAMWRWQNVEDRDWTRILMASKTPKQFLRLMRPHLFSNYYVGRRRLRVHNWFKGKCEKNSFTVEDFFRERSQELRRLILRHGVRIADVLGRLKFISEDEEGKLYDEVRETGGTEPEMAVSRYLYVKCPSTGQEYLLAVPFNFFSQAERDVINLDTPKKARRWTFRLRQDAEFAAEA